MTQAIELLRPSQIRAAFEARSLVYLPLGTIEWHCEHLPVGLDALTAYGICSKAAEKTGGLVWPTLYYGTGGDHGEYPWTVMMEGSEELEVLLRKTFSRLATLGVRRAVLFSGHFADGQLEMIDRLAAEASGHLGISVVATAVNRFDVVGFPPDHAGKFETTLLAGLHPDTIDLSALPDIESGDDRRDRHDPASPLWGVIGADPRNANLSEGSRLVEEIAVRLAAMATDA
ncbi:creatininase family protein [Rhizobium grahamii]|uniref:Creatininase family protein n=1 Tax=Rhizobium grahamii TaxID=1120045 RepID=A0A5Q0C3G4_9HYPH|nr:MULTISPECIES: creatininase family protein [Rhizobium]QFY60438.1 creatininase family protein [Rhizobium grahamii]QRM50434.1 creatininase family protein [Rhizobium sp. BG6]